jgi:hypothetical protein
MGSNDSRPSLQWKFANEYGHTIYFCKHQSSSEEIDDG